MNNIVQLFQVILIAAGAVFLKEIGFFENANWPVVAIMALISGAFMFAGINATVKTIKQQQQQEKDKKE